MKPVCFCEKNVHDIERKQVGGLCWHFYRTKKKSWSGSVSCQVLGWHLVSQSVILADAKTKKTVKMKNHLAGSHTSLKAWQCLDLYSWFWSTVIQNFNLSGLNPNEHSGKPPPIGQMSLSVLPWMWPFLLWQSNISHVFQPFLLFHCDLAVNKSRHRQKNTFNALRTV